MKAPETLGDRVRKLRRESGLTQKQVAEPGYTAAYISTVESGKRTPSRAAVEHIAAALNVSPGELLSGNPPDLAVRLELQLQDGRRHVYGGRLDDASLLFREVQREAQARDLGRLQAGAETGLGLVEERLGHPDRALEHYDRALEMLRGEPTPIRVEAVAGASRCHVMLGDARFALHVLADYIDELHRRDLADPTALVRAHSSMVGAYFAAGLPEKAVEAAEEALRLAPTVDDPEQLAHMHINVARSLLFDGRPNDALDSLRQAAAIYASLDMSSQVALAHIARGIVTANEGRFDEARLALEGALDLLERAPSALDRARALNELARVERLSGNDARAIELLMAAISQLRDTDVRELAFSYRELGIAKAGDDPKEAEKCVRASIDLYKKTTDRTELASSYQALGDLLAAQRDLESSNAAYREGIVVLAERRPGE